MHDPEELPEANKAKDESNNTDEQFDSTLRSSKDTFDGSSPPSNVFSAFAEEPKVIGNYRIESSIGFGGMGAVFKAFQSEPVKRHVALKLIRQGRATDQVIARFNAERQALAIMDHPFIAKIYDAGETENGQPYFAMEFVDGVPLTTYCDQQSLSIENRLELFVQICEGVHHAHQKGIIHRDLKPSNILVAEFNDKPAPKIIDFGLAKALEVDTDLTDNPAETKFGQVLGTIRYMSPEQAATDNLDIDTRADIYSLGVILYELLIGSTPLESKSIHEKNFHQALEIIRDFEPARPSSRFSTNHRNTTTVSTKRNIQPHKLSQMLSGELDWIVMKAIEKDRDRRYTSASDFSEDVNRFLQNEPVLARPLSRAYRIKKFASKHFGLVSAAAAILLIMCIGTATTTAGFLQARQERNLAVKEKERTESVLDIVVKSFKSATPGQGGSADMLAADVLENANKFAADSDLDDVGKSRLLGAIVTSLIGIGDYEPAVSAGQKQLELNKKIYGSENENTIRAMTDLAVAFLKVGNKVQALEMDLETVELAKKTLGSTNAETLRAMTNLGVSYFHNNKLDDAIRINEEALKIRNSEFGEESLESARSLSNLAVDYAKLKPPRLDDAISMELKAIAIRQKQLGDSHPDTLISINNLAGRYLRKGNLDQALSQFKNVLKFRKKELGENHPQTLRSIVNVAVIQFMTGDSDNGIASLEDVLKRMISINGPSHPDTINVRNRLAKFYKKSGRAKNGMLKVDKLRLVRAIEEYGIDHPETNEQARVLSGLYRQQKELRKADQLDKLITQIKKLFQELEQL